MGLKQDAIAFVGELVGTTMFLFLALGGVQTAQNSMPIDQQNLDAGIGLSNDAIFFISASMGLSLLVNVWAFYRVSGGLFNPAVTLALFLIGGLTPFRAVLLFVAQIAGGILGAGLADCLTPHSIGAASTTLADGMNIGQGLFMEAFLTAMLVFVILMLAAEKHRATYLAPIGIGLTLFVCQLLGTLWTGCGMNPARSFGPSVIAKHFVGYHWIYWIGPFIGSLIATGLYVLLKAFDYELAVAGQDSDVEANSPQPMFANVVRGFTGAQKKALESAGVPASTIDAAEKGLSQSAPDATADVTANASGQNTGAIPAPKLGSAVAN